MTDRELLERAAKAAGIEIRFQKIHDQNNNAIDFCFELTKPFGMTAPWNPLTDDGNALRLAVKLKLLVVICGDYVETIWDGCMRVEYGGPIKLELGDDPYAATRRAIVRAAAEIGGSL